MEKYKGEKFLDQLYKDLYKDASVVKYSGNKNLKYQNLNQYFKQLERVHLLATTSKRESDLRYLKQLYYDKYVIKEEDIKEAYFQKRPEQSREEATKNLMDSQKRSLDPWLSYFMGEEARKYPMWVCYFVFQGMLQLGSYQDGSFMKRTKDTTASFAPFYENIVSCIMRDIYQMVEEKKDIKEEEVGKLLKEGSFKKLYTYYYNQEQKKKKQERTSLDGIFKEYKQKENYHRLFHDLYQKGTSWCIEENRSDAKEALENSSLYIYYTKDKDGEYSIPRSAIRLRDGKVVEIRGIRKNQCLEDEMIDVTFQKANTFFLDDHMKQKMEDVKRLSSLFGQKEFSLSDLRFLYEVDRKINYLGYQIDERYQTFMEQRDQKEDLARIFSCKKEEIGMTERELDKPYLVCYYGDIKCYTEELEKSIPPYVVGDINMRLLKTSKGLDRLKEVSGDVMLDSLEDFDHLQNLNVIHGMDCNHILERIEAIRESKENDVEKKV